MNKQSVLVGAIALALVAIAVSSVLVTTRKNRLELSGDVLKVRTHQMDPEHTIVLIDVRVHNPSTQQFVVREVEVFVEEPGGKSTPAELFSEIDIQRVIDYYKMLGTKDNPGLLRRDKLNPGATTDRTIAVSAPMTDERFGQRRALRIRVHDVDRKTTEIVEERK
jgi:hypothetical protein